MTLSDLGVALRLVRGEATLDEFGASVGLHGKTISRWENGNRRPTRGQAIELLLRLRDGGRADRARLAALARILGVEESVVPLAVATEGPPRATEQEVSAKIDGALLRAAEALDVSPRVLRRTLAEMLAAIDEGGWSVAELRAIVLRAG
jgi:transcriptional regulator with XRE-family HTH domain